MLNGFSTLYYEDISTLFHSRPTCTDTLLSPHTILPMALSLSPFITLTQSVERRALQMFSLSHRRPDHILTFQHTSLIIISGVIELKISLNRVYLCNQISAIKTRAALTLHNWVFTLQTCSFVQLASLRGACYFYRSVQVAFSLVVSSTCRGAEWILLDVSAWIGLPGKRCKTEQTFAYEALLLDKLQSPWKWSTVTKKRKYSEMCGSVDRVL